MLARGAGLATSCDAHRPGLIGCLHEGMRFDPRSPLVVLAFALTAIAVPSCKSSSPDEPVTAVAATDCTKQTVFSAGRIVGTSLPPHTLALTFDDGPSARTAELSAYLKAEGIAAGFFVNGMFVTEFPTVLPQVFAQGHLIANHSQQHQDLTDPAFFPPGGAGDAALVAAVADTDALIAPYLQNGRRLFRAPYGRWDARAFAVLDASLMHDYVGPIDWDVGDSRTATTAADWACWQDAPQLSSKDCGDLYLAQITKVDRGIVLMHDAAYGNEENHVLTTGVGNTVDMVKYMVPILKAAGFTFVRVDHVPAIEAQLPPIVLAPDGGTDGGSKPGIAGDGSPGENPGPETPDPSLTAPQDDPCGAAPKSRHAH